jgi:hypothetical protein
MVVLHIPPEGGHHGYYGAAFLEFAIGRGCLRLQKLDGKDCLRDRS